MHEINKRTTGTLVSDATGSGIYPGLRMIRGSRIPNAREARSSRRPISDREGMRRCLM